MGRIGKITVFLALCLSFGFVFAQDVFAQTDKADLIDKVTYLHAPNCGNHNNKWKATLFTVKFKWGDGCYDDSGKNRCSIVSNSFHCIAAGKYCSTTSTVHNGSISLRKQTTGNYGGCKSNNVKVCYKVWIPVDSGYQKVKGVIKVAAKHTLTVHYIDVGGSDIATKSVKTGIWYNTKVTATNQSIDGYMFKGWKETKSGEYKSTGSSYAITVKKNRDLYAVYCKINADTGDCSESPTITTIESDCNSWTPSSYSAKYTSTISKVRNATLGTDWEENVYAKPGDSVYWVHCYYPGVQEMAKEEVTDPSSHTKDNTNLSSPYTYSLVYKKISDIINWENRYTISASNFSSAKSSATESFAVGDSTTRTYEDTTYSVENSKAGLELKEKITSGSPIYVSIVNRGAHYWGCWWGIVGYHDVCSKYDKDDEDEDGDTTECLTYVQVADYGWTRTCAHTDDFIDFSKDNGPATSSANVLVPYNFHNRTEIEGEDEDLVYAGETKGVNFSLMNLPKENSVTNGTYATKSNSKYKLRVCYSEGETYSTETSYESGDTGDIESEVYDDADEYEDEEDEEDEEEDDDEGGDETGDGGDVAEGEPIEGGVCYESDEVGITLNSNSNKNGETRTLSETINVSDVNAGTEMCVQSAVWAQNSGEDTNWSDPDGNHTWSYSPTVACYTVAKKPSLQVWGGNVYTRYTTATYSAQKGNIAGQNEYKVLGSYNKHVFGSWAELGVISNGAVSGFASGASTGYAMNQNGTLIPNQKGGNTVQEGVGGTTKTGFCARSVLTIANDKCNSGYAGNIGVLTAFNRVNNDKESIISKLIDDSSAAVGTSEISTDDITNGDTNYYKSDGDMSVNSATIGLGKLKVAHAKGNIYIKGNIVYADGNYYTKLYEAPKMVIYAEGNVYIDCGVSRVDALIMAGKTVYTCANANGEIPDLNSSERSNQLTINGAIIADGLSADRTYGAATGANSMVSAEIINFDPTLYLWAGTTEDTDDNVALPENLETTYIRELAPRL